ncbi:uncharacterized protein LOC129910662 [Episyrphus balteatus]|uniref:uncharacterized protein LOC129910662 n=1 Tax=Episyrphus balteatus TaxID=286459 RepID=UPI00248565E1|nr:uncharacterized protein LOC129910662 [Episyrphus balteatus]
MSLESTPSSLLTRDDITSILNERHLKIPNIELMSYEDLLRIYETFAQPLEKRNTKRTQESSLVVPQQHSSHPRITFNEDFQINRVIPSKIHEPPEFPPTKYIKLSFNTIQSFAKKRSNGVTINAAQEATPSKRKPISWP